MLKELTIPDGTKEIKNEALNGLYFSKITLPSSIEKIADNGLGNLLFDTTKDTNIERYGKLYYNGTLADYLKIKYESMQANPMWSEDGSVTMVAGNLLYINGTLITDLEIPNGTKYIGVGQFAGCGSLTSIKFNSELEAIGACAFSRCSNLTSSERIIGIRLNGINDTKEYGKAIDVEIPANVQYIGDCAFESVQGGITIYIHRETKTVGTYVAVTGRLYYDGTIWESPIFTDNNYKNIDCDSIEELSKELNNTDTNNWLSFFKSTNDSLSNIGYGFGFGSLYTTMIDNVKIDDIIAYGDYKYIKLNENKDVKLAYYILHDNYGRIVSNNADYSAIIVPESFSYDEVNYTVTEIDDQVYSISFVASPSFYFYIPKTIKKFNLTQGLRKNNEFSKITIFYDGTQEEFNNIDFSYPGEYELITDFTIK